MSTIPIHNLYYLLSYAWSHLELGERLSTGITDYQESLDLYTRVLLNGCGPLLARGLHREYQDLTESYPGLRGRLLLTESLQRNTFPQGRTICVQDELTANILPNQLLKATLYRLLRTPKLDSNLRKEVRRTYDRFNQVGLHHTTPSAFTRVRLDRNNLHYDFLLKISRLIYEQTALIVSTGTYAFTDFFRNKRMGEFFEAFVQNFYRKHLKNFSVSSPKIKWQAQHLSGINPNLLPQMNTDVWLENTDRIVILDTKFYKNTLATGRFSNTAIHSAHLYQISAYLRNAAESLREQNKPNPEGILLYPTVNDSLKEVYQLNGHRLQLVTLNLNQPWQGIHEELLNIMGADAGESEIGRAG
jgi:5-methylcytosine-specific restriction enzyme subunit McrC